MTSLWNIKISTTIYNQMLGRPRHSMWGRGIHLFFSIRVMDSLAESEVRGSVQPGNHFLLSVRACLWGQLQAISNTRAPRPGAAGQQLGDLEAWRPGGCGLVGCWMLIEMWKMCCRKNHHGPWSPMIARRKADSGHWGRKFDFLGCFQRGLLFFNVPEVLQASRVTFHFSTILLRWNQLSPGKVKRNLNENF